MTEEYKKINFSLKRIENYQYAPQTIEWCADRIAWAWKWRKITEEEMKELTFRVSKIFGRKCRIK